jgi:hypothetical protein
MINLTNTQNASLVRSYIRENYLKRLANLCGYDLKVKLVKNVVTVTIAGLSYAPPSRAMSEIKLIES